AIIAESIFDFQWTFERRGKILEKLPLWRSISTTRNARNRKTRATTARDTCWKRSVGKCTELLIIQSRMAQSIKTYRSLRRLDKAVRERRRAISRTDSHCP